MRRRARDRRQSLVQPSKLNFSASLQETQASPAKDATAEATTQTAKSSKRRRSEAGMHSDLESESAAPPQAACRKARRQSIVGVVQLDLNEDGAEEKAEMNSGTSILKRKSPRRRQSTTPSKEEQAEENSEKKGNQSPLCELCYNEVALVRMNPCDHSVCTTCWVRLAPASSPASEMSDVARMCPWDRELVTKR